MKIRINTLKTAFLATLCWLSISCKNKHNRLSHHLREINKEQVVKIDMEDWVIRHEAVIDGVLYYDIEKYKGDTSIDLTFNFSQRKKLYVIESYYKLYYSKEDSLYYSLEMKRDTLYYYKMANLSSTEKEFIVGKYYYQYECNQLTPKQKKYFELHMDSLIKVRGDDLPKLPDFEQARQANNQ